MSKSILTFGIYQGEELVRRETVKRDVIKVGADPKSHVHLQDPSATRMHAVLEVGAANDITLIDLGSEGGTAVNGARVNKCRIRSGDEILIGRTRLVLEKVESSSEDTMAAPAMPLGVGSMSANPFVMARSPRFSGPVDDYTYSLLKSGPEVQTEEVELAHVPAVEVMVLWGTNVLHVAHLSPPREFWVGEEAGKNLKCDYFIPSEKLGATRVPLVVGDASSASVVIPPGAQGFVELSGQPRMTLDQARQKAEPSLEFGGHRLALPLGGKARIEVADFVFQVSAVHAGKPVQKGAVAGLESAVFGYFGLSLASVGGFVAMMAFLVPPLGLTDDENMSQDQVYLIQQYLQASAEREPEAKETEVTQDEAADEREGGTGTRARGDEGSMGNPTSRAVNRRWAVAGDKNNLDPHIAREAAIHDAQRFGLIGILNTGAAGDPNAPTAPWGRDDSLGNDELSARGNMWGDEIGDAFGAGGLGLSGIGEGGGGRGEGIGLGSIGFGHGAGTGTGQGFGSGHGRLAKGHKTKTFSMRVGQTVVSGRLPPEVIQRIVRQNYGRFRMCYEQGLSRNPNLEGRVQVRFVIGRDGSVSNVQNGGSDLPDSGVVGCVVSAYYGLSFPQPEGGIVTVVYPIMFQPG